MAQRLALKTKVRESSGDRIVFFSDFKEFMRRAEELGFGPRAEIRVDFDEDEKEFFFWVPIPGKVARLPDGRRKVVRRPTKKQLEAKEQIDQHKNNVAKGIKTKGHIPGVVKKKRVVRKKKK